jgi:hypothetical protein
MSTPQMILPARLMMVLATVVIGVQTSLAEPAADDCKTTPGSSAPAGQHWYYRVNRSDQRHCWYLGAEGTKVRAQTREKVSSPPARTARDEASEARATMPPPMEIMQAPSVPEASSPAPVAAEFVRPALDLQKPPDPTAREPAITSNTSAPDVAEAQEEMPLVWPVLTDAERAGSPDSARRSAPWAFFLIVGGALLVVASLVKLAWRARSQLRRHPPLRQSRPRQQNRAHAAHPAAPPRSSRPQTRLANPPRRQVSPVRTDNRSAAAAKPAGAHA